MRRKKKLPSPNADEFLPLREEEAQIRKEIARLVGEHVRQSERDRAELAARLGYRSPAQLSKWIAGKAVIPPEKLALLADLLGVSVSSFFPSATRPRASGWREAMAAAIAQKDYPAALSTLVQTMKARHGE